tara:strand:+ start:2006 stop:2728 length:723 start_codon:yes stop_codon:yes gene_type:complete
MLKLFLTNVLHCVHAILLASFILLLPALSLTCLEIKKEVDHPFWLDTITFPLCAIPIIATVIIGIGLCSLIFSERCKTDGVLEFPWLYDRIGKNSFYIRIYDTLLMSYAILLSLGVAVVALIEGVYWIVVGFSSEHGLGIAKMLGYTAAAVVLFLCVLKARKDSKQAFVREEPVEDEMTARRRQAESVAMGIEIAADELEREQADMVQLEEIKERVQKTLDEYDASKSKPLSRFDVMDIE